MPDPKHTFRAYIIQHRWSILAGILCVLMTQLLRLVGPYMAKVFIDFMTVAGQELYPKLQAMPHRGLNLLLLSLIGLRIFQVVGTCIIVILLATAISGIFQFYQRQTIIRTSRTIELTLRQALFTHLQRLSPSFYTRNQTGDLMSRCTADMEAVRMAVGPGILHTANSSLAFLIQMSAMFIYNPVLATWILGPIILLMGCLSFLMKRMYASGQAVQENLAIISSAAQENFSGTHVIKAFGREDQVCADMEEKCQTHLQAYLRHVLQQGQFRSVVLSFSGLLYLLILFIGGRQIMTGDMSTGDLVFFLMLVSRLVWPMIAIGWVASLWQRGRASMDRIHEILDTQPDVHIQAEEASPKEIQGNIEIRNLDFRYDNGPLVLKNISLHIPAGSQVGIIGRTGSGKTTLLRLLLHLYPLPANKLFIDNIDIHHIPLQHLRENIAYVPQESFLFSESIAENIGFGLHENPTPELVQSMASLTAMHEDIMEFQYGYQQKVGERGVTLSGGQKQRVSIARAVIKKAPILMLDDSLSAVDTQTEETILQNLQKNNLRPSTRIVVAHRVSTICNSDLILVLDEGRIAERGTHEELLALGGMYANLHQKQLLSQEIDGYN